MPDKSTIEKLIDSAPLAVILIGVVVVTLGAAGGLPIGNPPLQVTDPGWKIALGVMGAVLVLGGLLLVVRERWASTGVNSPSANSKGGSIVLLQDYPEVLKSDFEKGTEIWLVGVSLGSTINDHYSLLENKIKRGNLVRILVRDPDGETFRLVSRHSYSPINPEQVRAKLQLTLTRLCDLKRTAPNNIEIRVLDHPFVLGMFAIDPESPSGKFYIEYYPFKMPKSGQPKIVLTPHNAYWYDFYKQQLNTLWGAGKPWNC